MSERKALELLRPAGAEAGMGRRTAIRTLVGGIGAGAAIPGLAQTHPVHNHLASPAAVAEAAAAAAKAAAKKEWKPAFLDAHQAETFLSLAEQIVPGSTTAAVTPFVDKLLEVDTQDNQRRFLNALGAIEGAAIARYGHPWKALTSAQQVELLTAVSTAEGGAKDATGGVAQATLRDHFDNLKGWVVGVYFSSEPGMRELGWTGNVFHAEFPGCPHPDGHR
jgi:gluconate 2-dehydrogenase subunit 3-like protein